MNWYTADLHFNHSNVIEFCNRPWKTVDEMNDGLIKRWNQFVKDGDTVYILGDMFFCGIIKMKEIMPTLMGKKILILGNHDWKKVKKHRAQELGFEWVADEHCVRIAGVDVLMSHFPYRGDHMGEERFKECRPKDFGNWLMHGHVHNLWTVRDKMINVGVDVWNWCPVSEKSIAHIINTRKALEDAVR